MGDIQLGGYQLPSLNSGYWHKQHASNNDDDDTLGLSAKINCKSTITMDVSECMVRFYYQQWKEFKMNRNVF